MVLVGGNGRVAYANIASRQLLAEGRSLDGQLFAETLTRLPQAFRDATRYKGDALISAEIEGVEESFHLSQRAFILQGRNFNLYLIRQLTRELSRKEVETWKKLIRVLSHEINNSLGPLASLAHTGAEIARRGDIARLPTVRAAIGERGTLARFRRRLRNVREAPRPAASTGAVAHVPLGSRATIPLQAHL